MSLWRDVTMQVSLVSATGWQFIISFGCWTYMTCCKIGYWRMYVLMNKVWTVILDGVSCHCYEIHKELRNISLFMRLLCCWSIGIDLFFFFFFLYVYFQPSLLYIFLYLQKIAPFYSLTNTSVQFLFILNLLHCLWCGLSINLAYCSFPKTCHWLEMKN